jgi:GT2 family glycosyltransferase
MFISVVVAVRNEIKHIEKCITSLFTQGYKGKYEVIIVDGISTDNTYELLTKLQKKYPFKLFRNPKINAAAGRNIGINNATGDHIAFIDGDAIAASDWLTQITKAFKKSNATGVGGPDLLPKDANKTAHIIGAIMTSPLAQGGRLNPSTQHTLMEEERYVEHIPTCNVCYKKEPIEKIGMFDETFAKGQDLELSYRIIQAGYKLYYSPKIKVTHYRKQNISDFARQIYKWAKAKIAIIKKHGIINHAYLLPLYGLIALFALLALSIIFNFLSTLILLFFLGVIAYIAVILLESAKLAKKYQNRTILTQGLILFPTVHFAYLSGVIAALVRKKIW